MILKRFLSVLIAAAVVAAILLAIRQSIKINYGKEKVNEFHVKVQCHADGRFGKYCIVFTDDNFDTEVEINEAFDISINSRHVAHQLKLFKSESEAIEYAKKFTTLEKCLQYNDSVKVAYDSIYNSPTVQNYPVIVPDPTCVNKGVVVY